MGQTSLRIVLTGGLSGGHTFPLLAVAQMVKARSPLPVELLFIGSQGKLEKEAMAEAGIRTKYIAVGKWRRYFSVQNFIDLFKLPFGFLQALWHLLWFMPDAVFAKGGSVSVPMVIAAWIYQIPIVLHESDAQPGVANRFLARFVQRIAIAYDGAHQFFPAEKTALTGNPVRREMTGGNVAEALDTFRLRADASILLVLGGSQGSGIINENLLRVLPALIEKGYQVVHLTGENNFEEVAQKALDAGLDIEKGPYRPLPFLASQPLADLYQAAQVVLSRAGAGTIAELAANKKAVILVPLKSAANDHQRMNAYELAEKGAAKVLEEANLTEHLVLGNLEELLTNQELRQKMGEALSTFYHPEAAERIAVALLELAVA